jgi:hypothetical protein
MYGGTALALRFGHRSSDDFDFFSNSFPPERLLETAVNLPMFKEFSGTVSHTSPVGHQTDMILAMPGADGGTVKLTLQADRKLTPGCYAPPDTVSENGVKIAAVMDLFATKLNACHGRSVKRDFTDLAELVRRGHDLELAFSILLAICRTVGKTHLLRLDYLRNDLMGGSAGNFIEDREGAELLRRAAGKVNLDKVFKSRIAIDVTPFGTPYAKPSAKPSGKASGKTSGSSPEAVRTGRPSGGKGPGPR